MIDLATEHSPRLMAAAAALLNAIEYNRGHEATIEMFLGRRTEESPGPKDAFTATELVDGMQLLATLGLIQSSHQRDRRIGQGLDAAPSIGTGSVALSSDDREDDQYRFPGMDARRMRRRGHARADRYRRAI